MTKQLKGAGIRRPLEPIKRPWAKEEDEVIGHYDVDPEKGLSDLEVTKRRHRFGPNKLREAKKTSLWKILFDQFKSLLVVLLAVATLVSFLFGEWLEGTAIGVVIVINTCIGFYTEYRAIRSMEALHELTKVDSKVIREGDLKKIPADQLVPGDLVVMESGDIISADIRLIESSQLKVDESTLTGESLPVSKDLGILDKEIPLADRENMVFKGTFITRGSGKGVVVSTGMDTELGKISSFIEEAEEEEETPLEKRLDKLGQKLVWVLLGIAGVVAVSGIIRGKDIYLMIETSIALAVATVPEGLPIVATIALARGMWRMAKRNALVNRLSSVETLGSTSIICTDKTGTLTENRMTVSKYLLDDQMVEVSGTGLEIEGDFSSDGREIEDDRILEKALEVGVLCNNAAVHYEKEETKVIGDPMEVSLLIAGMKAGIERSSLVDNKPEVREESFDPNVKMMATYHSLKDGFEVAVKGAPEEVLNVSKYLMTSEGKKDLTEDRKDEILSKNREMAESGLRVLALAFKEVKDKDEKPYSELTYLSLVGMLDPPRKEVRSAIEKCQRAGIRVIMVTGDQTETARNIGYSVGLVTGENVDVVNGNELKEIEELNDEERKRFIDAPIFSRVSPGQKLDIIDIHQDNGSIVAMTGDGVNDAPALKKADIGVSMGKRGTQVAREASDMILQDDNFSTIGNAVEEGRIIFNNIRKFVFYLLSCNLSELFVILTASLLDVPLPILPLQILFLNVVTDIFPAFALGAGQGSKDIMKKSPRDPKESILTKAHWKGIGSYGVIMTVAVLGAFTLSYFYYDFEVERVVTISFLTLAFSQLWHVFNMRERGSKFFINEVTENKYVWLSLLLCTGLLLLATYLPGLSFVLKTVDPGRIGWTIIIIASLVTWFVGQIRISLYPYISRLRG
ncbi:MAG: cation-translocating P-type ATPase [Thermoplasmatota archaeon]